MAKNTLIITNGYYWKKVPFEEGEMLLAVLQRHVDLPSPCGGKGAYGRCMVEILGEDGEYYRILVLANNATVKDSTSKLDHEYASFPDSFKQINKDLYAAIEAYNSKSVK